MQQVRDDLVHIAFPFGQVCDGKYRVDAVVASAVDRFHVKTVEFKNAEDVAVFNDSLRQTNPVVPHVIRFLVKGKSIESGQVHIGIY